MTHRVSKITYLIALSLLLSLLAVFSSCREEELPVAVTSVSLNSTSMELVEGTTQTLVATVSPSNAENQKVIWSSSNSSVASVTDGVVTAVKAGTATITVKTDDGNKSAICEVTVLQDDKSDAIAFADDIVKKSCVEAFDTDGDGEISYNEAAAVTDLSNVALRYIEYFSTFDEFQYFINVKSIPDRFFYESKLLKSITLPESIKTIGVESFAACTALTMIELPEGLNSIGIRAFWNCSGLTKIEFPQSLETIDVEAFWDCTGLTDIKFPESLKTIWDWIFVGCTGLTEIELPEGLETIGVGTFRWCSGLTKVSFPERLKNIGAYAFNGCIGLTEIEFPEGLESIADLAFMECTGLTRLEFPENLKIIGSMAFSHCEKLSSIIILGTHGELSIHYRAFGDNGFGTCSLKTIHIERLVPPTSPDSKELNGITDETAVYVPTESVDLYKKSILKNGTIIGIY